MRFSSTMLSLCALSILLLLIGSNNVTADSDDSENDGDISPCWGGDWDSAWWVAGMMIMMMGGVLVILIVSGYIFRNELLQSPPPSHSYNNNNYNDNYHKNSNHINRNYNDNNYNQNNHGNSHHSNSNHNNTMRSQLDERYARGEISKEDYINHTIDNFINRFTEEE